MRISGIRGILEVGDHLLKSHPAAAHPFPLQWLVPTTLVPRGAEEILEAASSSVYTTDQYP